MENPISNIILIHLVGYFMCLWVGLFFGTRQKAASPYLFWTFIILSIFQGYWGFLLFYSLMGIQPAWLATISTILFFSGLINLTRNALNKRKQDKQDH